MSIKPNDLRKTPPHWCKDAIPSVRGWCDPKTGELLISVKGIQFDVLKPVTEKAVDKVVVDVENALQAVLSDEQEDNTVDEVAEVVEEVKDVVEIVKSGKKAPAKKTTAAAKKTSSKTTAKKK